MATVELSSIDGFIVGLNALLDLDEDDLAPLGEAWKRTLTEDNRKGILEQTNKFGAPMPPPRYRTGTGRKTAARRAKYGTAGPLGTFGGFKGFGPWRSGLNNNLTTEEYMALDGPYLAPRRANSRVITNYQTAFGQTGPTTFEAVGAWFDIVDYEGKPFLDKHLNDGVHDIAGVRPWGLARATKDLQAFTDAYLERIF